MAIKEVLHTDLAPAAVGPYSQAIAANGFVFTSGQVPIDPKEGKIVATTIEEQTEQVMKNLQCVLAQGGVSFDRVVKTTCFLSDINDFAAFNGVYAKYFPEGAPARSCVEVAALPLGAKVEVEVVAGGGSRRGGVGSPGSGGGRRGRGRCTTEKSGPAGRWPGGRPTS